MYYIAFHVVIRSFLSHWSCVFLYVIAFLSLQCP